ASGNGGLGGSGGSPGGSAGAGGTRGSGPGGHAGADARQDSEPDPVMPTGGPEGQSPPGGGARVVEAEGGSFRLGGVVLNEVNAQGALEDYIELINNDSTAIDIGGYSVAQGTGMFGLPDTLSFLTFAPGTMVGPGEHLLVIANQAPPRMKGEPNAPCNVP